jgi:CheY-like chemotaxis protein
VGEIAPLALLLNNARKNTMRSSKPILLVEDDSADVLIVKRAMKELQINNNLVQLNNGEEALAYLTDKTNPRPCIILLDLNMPKMNGIELLRIIKNDDNIRYIPVVALTTSQSSDDISECFKLGIAGYIVKPVDFKKFLKTVRIVDLYWMLSQMPSETMNDIKLENINLDLLREEIALADAENGD